MTDAALKVSALQRQPIARTEPAPPRLVRMRRFGIGEGSTVPISIATGAGILALWWAVAQTGLIPHLFLPTPAEVLSTARSIYEDGYANATLWEHISASLARILSAALIAVTLGIPIGIAMGLNAVVTPAIIPVLLPWLAG